MSTLQTNSPEDTGLKIKCSVCGRELRVFIKPGNPERVEAYCNHGRADRMAVAVYESDAPGYPKPAELEPEMPKEETADAGFSDQPPAPPAPQPAQPQPITSQMAPAQSAPVQPVSVARPGKKSGGTEIKEN